MRVLGIPSRVVTVFNAAHDTDGSLSVEEYYSSTGEKLNLTKDSVWLVSLYLRSDFFFNCIVFFCFVLSVPVMFSGAHIEHSFSQDTDNQHP